MVCTVVFTPFILKTDDLENRRPRRSVFAVNSVHLPQLGGLKVLTSTLRIHYFSNEMNCVNVDLRVSISYSHCPSRLLNIYWIGLTVFNNTADRQLIWSYMPFYFKFKN
jgi:hypothetical protein